MNKYLKILLINVLVFVSFVSIVFLVITSSFHYFEKKYNIQSLVPFKVYDKWIPETPKDFVFYGLEKYTTRFGLGGSYKSNYINDDGSIEYEVEHTIGDIGSRIDLFKNKDADKHLLAVGDSQTFGVGVQDSEVYSNLLANKLQGSNIRVYNLGFRGWGPANNYLLFDKKLFDIKKYINEKSGTFVYLFTPELVERDSGTSSVFGYLYGTLAFYEERNGEFVTDGMFEDSFKTSFDRFIASLGYTDKYDKLKQRVLPDIINRVSWRRMYEKTAKIFLQMQRDYLRSFPGSKFIILVCDYRFKNDKLLNEVFDRFELNYIDYRNEKSCLGDRNYFFSENHLSQNGHRNITDKILRDILAIED